MIVSEKVDKIICPKCSGVGKVTCTRRVSMDEDERWEEKCKYCNGKRLVKRITTTEDFEVEDLNINPDKIRY